MASVTPTPTSRRSDPTTADELTASGDDPAGPEPDLPHEPGPGARPGCHITLDLSTPDCDPPATGWLDAQMTHIAGLAGLTDCRLNLAVVDDARMSELHSRYLRIDGTTDVLTFDLRDEPDGPVEGDIVICMDEARRQAKERGHDTRLELLLYAVHGLLHLMGEDDHAPADYEKMHRREDELLMRAGLGAVFGVDD
jgi:probable rRNA maturation factor